MGIAMGIAIDKEIITKCIDIKSGIFSDSEKFFLCLFCLGKFFLHS